jgi:serine/threonine protein kinase
MNGGDEQNRRDGDVPVPEYHRFAPGELIAERYRIVGLIGEGAIGEVYEAEDAAMGEVVALKTLKAALSAHAVTVERFRREIQFARKVTHRNVCRTFDLGRHDLGEGAHVNFLTMEFLRGHSLAQRLAEGGRLTAAQALPLVEQMIAGLDAAHGAGVIHRDFKPGNLVLVPEPGAPPTAVPRVVITDFGLARRYSIDEQTITVTGEAIGTPLYMAPEQVAAGLQQITPATDVYALGIVMYELVTGELPFKGKSTVVMALKRFKEAAPSARAVVPDLDPRWDAAILRCLEREPSRRFQRASEVLAALNSDVAQSAPASAEPAKKPTGKFRRVLRRVIGARPTQKS